MEIGIISMRYAKALIGFAQEKGEEDEVYQEIKRLSHSFRTQSRLRDALGNPILQKKEKRSLIHAATNGSDESSEVFARFVDLVLNNKRELYLQYICLSYEGLYRKLKHIGIGKLITAMPVEKATEDRIRKSAGTILHARMELETLIDPSIEGGFIFDVNDYRLDASVATQLKRVKQQFIDKNKRIV